MKITTHLGNLHTGDVFAWMGSRFVVDAEHYYDCDVDDHVLVCLWGRNVAESFPRDTMVEFLGMDGRIQ